MNRLETIKNIIESKKNINSYEKIIIKHIYHKHIDLIKKQIGSKLDVLAVDQIHKNYSYIFRRVEKARQILYKKTSFKEQELQKQLKEKLYLIMTSLVCNLADNLSKDLLKGQGKIERKKCWVVDAIRKFSSVKGYFQIHESAFNKYFHLDESFLRRILDMTEDFEEKPTYTAMYLLVLIYVKIFNKKITVSEGKLIKDLICKIFLEEVIDIVVDCSHAEIIQETNKRMTCDQVHDQNKFKLQLENVIVQDIQSISLFIQPFHSFL